MKYRIGIALLIGIILYFICFDKKLTNDDVIITETDTTRITFIDTIRFIDTVVHKLYIKINTPVIINDSTNEYFNDFSDSLLTGSVWSLVTGKLLDQTVDYTPRFPQYILQTDTIIINTSQTTIRESSNFSLNVGLEVGGNTDKFNFSPMVGLTSGRGTSYSYRYGVLDKTHNVGIMYNLKMKR
tara:strand:+ start:16154 stop:16705 length:552 start_codon:yes stop_codon:yes gene_type:complete